MCISVFLSCLINWNLWGCRPHNTFPRGEGAPVRTLGRMRNGDMFRICMHFVKKVHWKSLYCLNWLHCE